MNQNIHLFTAWNFFFSPVKHIPVFMMYMQRALAELFWVERDTSPEQTKGLAKEISELVDNGWLAASEHRLAGTCFDFLLASDTALLACLLL